MLITNHVLSGAAVGWLAPGTTAALATGVASHVVLDAVPHFGVEDDQMMRVAVPDGLLGLAVIAGVAASTPRRHRLRVLAGIAGACLPDLNKPCEQFFGFSPFPRSVDRAHGAIQIESTRLFPVELGAAAASVLALRALRRRRG